MVIRCEPPSASRHRVVATATHCTHSGAHNSLVRRCFCTSRHVQSICRLGRCLWAKFDPAWTNHFATSALGDSFIFCNLHSWQVQTRIPVVARPGCLTFRSRRTASPPLNSSVRAHEIPTLASCRVGNFPAGWLRHGQSIAPKQGFQRHLLLQLRIVVVHT